MHRIREQDGGDSEPHDCWDLVLDDVGQCRYTEHDTSQSEPELQTDSDSVKRAIF